MRTDNTKVDNNRAKVLGGQTCLPCRDEYGLQRRIQTAAGGGGKLVVSRRLHSSLIAEEVTRRAQYHYGIGGGYTKNAHTTLRDGPRVVRMGGPLESRPRA